MCLVLFKKSAHFAIVACCGGNATSGQRCCHEEQTNSMTCGLLAEWQKLSPQQRCFPKWKELLAYASSAGGRFSSRGRLVYLRAREALLRYSWQESVLSARGLGEWRLPLGALQAGVSTALLWWACMSGAPASTGLVWGHYQFVSPPSCSASFGFRGNLTPEGWLSSVWLGLGMDNPSLSMVLF